MKYILSLCIVAAMLFSCGNKHDHSQDHQPDQKHVHGENCTHDHQHEHGEACEHDHDHDHQHEHGEACEHDHEHDHQHEHGEASEHDHDHNHDHAPAEAAHNHGADAIIFTPEQAAKIDFEVAHPAMEPFGQVIKTTAQIQSSQSDEAIVSAKASGIVLFSGRNITEGQSVSSGQSLFSISGAGIDNNSAVRFAEAKSNYEKAEDAYKRAQLLVKETIISEKGFQEIKAEYEVAKAVYDNLQSNFTGNGQKVTASRPGFIKQLFVSNGQYVEEGQALFSITSNKSLILKADVAPRHAQALPFIQSATIRSMDKKKMYSLQELNGKVLSYGRSLNDGNYLLPVTFEVDNKAGFIPGGFVEMYIKTQSSEPVMTLPNSALTEEQGLFFVYVQSCPESYEKREITIGASDGIRTQVLSGLNKDEKVVTKGAMSVKLAQASGALDPHAGHVH